MSFSPHRSPAPSVRSSLKKLQQTSVDNKQQKSVEKAKLGDEKDRIIDSLRNELSTLQGKLEMQETTIENLSNYNNQLSANLSRTEKELAEVEVSFKESLQFIQSLHQKLKMAQLKSVKLQEEAEVGMKELATKLAEEKERNKSMEAKLEANAKMDASKTNAYTREFHRHLRDNFKQLAQRLVESLVLVEGDIEANSKLVESINDEKRKDGSPITANKKVSPGFIFGVPSRRHPVTVLNEGSVTIVDENNQEYEYSPEGSPHSNKSDGLSSPREKRLDYGEEYSIEVGDGGNDGGEELFYEDLEDGNQSIRLNGIEAFRASDDDAEEEETEEAEEVGFVGTEHREPNVAMERTENDDDDPYCFG